MKNKNNENKVKLSEKISLKFRKKWIVDSTKTFLIIAVLIVAYIALNLGIQEVDLPKLDVTENKIYTLSDASKDAIANINQDIKIYAFGFTEDSSLIDLLKQYNKANGKITYEILTSETNYEMIQKYQLQDGYYALILKSGDSEKVIDPNTEFVTYDYTTYEQIDTTEQSLTNSILALTEENKPKVYFVEGHGEFSTSELGILTTYLANEAFEVETLNISTTGSIPEDCDILAIMSPSTDFLENEVTAVKDYINKGGEIYFSMDPVSAEATFPNLQQILDEYGVSVENGYIIEQASNQYLPQYPYVFMPEVSSSNKITADIYTDSSIWLMYSSRLQFKSDEELETLNVEKEILLNSSDESLYATDLSQDLNTAMQSAPVGSSDIAAILTKTLNTEGEESDDSKTSNLIISATGSFITDYTSPLSESYPMSYMASNKDFVINAMSFLGEKDNILTIRKDMSSSTYTPTTFQNNIVTAVVFIVPLAIIIIGIIIWSYRKKRK